MLKFYLKARIAAVFLAMAMLTSPVIFADLHAVELAYPQIIHARYEASDDKAGGGFIIWLDREKLWHGLDQKLYPAVRYVDVTHVTPSPGSPTISIIEIMSINATVPEYYHVAGIARFKITGMKLVSSNIPVGK